MSSKLYKQGIQKIIIVNQIKDKKQTKKQTKKRVKMYQNLSFRICNKVLENHHYKSDFGHKHM